MYCKAAGYSDLKAVGIECSCCLIKYASILIWCSFDKGLIIIQHPGISSLIFDAFITVHTCELSSEF